MLFNSLQFLVLLAITLPLYYLPLPSRTARIWQVAILLIASAIFYGWENPALLPLLGVSILLNAWSTERILFHQANTRPTLAKRWMTSAVIANLLLLALFKYTGFLCGLLPDPLTSNEIGEWAKTIPLPVGISFYTFQGISLVVDTWRRDISPETAQRLAARGTHRAASIRDTGFYISFFPQLVAGPIVKAHEFIDQIGAKQWRHIDWKTVRRSLIAGYFLKIFVADNLAEQTAMLTVGTAALTSTGPVHLMALLYAYGLQIFSDFAGYSLIAIGLGALFGYRLPENFRFPYLSKSLTEFWRRWHLTLSSWLRDYLYIPLGGNRIGPTRTYINLFLVMFLGGLWHGAEWKFAIWGTLHGTFLAIERFLSRRRGRISANSPAPLKSLITTTLGRLYAFHVVTFLWLTFLMPDLAHIHAFFTGLTSGPITIPGQPLFALAIYGGAAIAYHLWGWLGENRPHLSNRFTHPLIEGSLHALMVFLILTNPGAPRGFIYFQF